MVEVPEGYEKVDAGVFRKGDELLIVGVLVPEGPFAFGLKLGKGAPVEENGPATWGPPPDGFEWTGEVRPPRKGEWFWSERHGRVVEAIMDETGVNQFGESTGGRRLLRPVPPPKRPRLRLVRDEEPGGR